MAFDWFRFARPAPTRDARGPNHHQRPPPVITRIHGRRPAPVPQVVPLVRRGHQTVLVPRGPALGRRGPVVRAPTRPPARPHPPPRVSSKLMQCLHVHVHPSHRRDVISAPRSSKPMSSHQVPPFPPPRGAVSPPRRHVHWAPAQAPLPQQPYPYPSHSSATSHAHSHGRATDYHLPMSIPRYQPPQHSRGPPQQKRR